MEYLKNVLIKESKGPDLVFIVDNLPKDLLFKRARKLVFVPRYAVDYDPAFPKQVEAYVLRNEDMPDEPRNRRITGEMVDELLPGIEASQTGDEGYVFFTQNHESRSRLDTIDRYIRNQLGPLAQIPERVEYSSVKGSFSASPKGRHLIPRVELPESVSPPVAQVTVQAPQPARVLRGDTREVDVLSPAPEPLKRKKEYTEEQLKEMRERLAAARAKRHVPK